MCSIEGCELDNYKEMDKCILHCEKSGNFEDIENFNTCFERLSKPNGEINHIHFPKKYDFNKSFYNKNGFKFTNCHFYSQLNLNGHEYINCHFYKVVKLSKNQTTYSIKCKFKNSIFLSIIQINDTFTEELFENCNFNKGYLYLKNINLKDINYLFNDSKISKFNFYNCIFPFKINLREINHIEKLVFRKCKFKDRFSIQHSEIKGILRLKDSMFLLENEINSKVKIQFSKISKVDFYNTIFQDLADFYQTKFDKVNFKRTDFEKISVFSETEFNCDVDFKYTKFLGKSIFRDTVIKGELNLRDAIFNDEANFLDITAKSRKVYNKEKKKDEFVGEPTAIKVANRETARVIKNFYDNSNNIIEANRFYKLEMKEREKELEVNLKKGKNFFEWFIFKLHGISSNHSQDWLLALFWIINFGLLYSFFEYKNFYTFTRNDFLMNQFLIGLLITLLAFSLLISLIKVNKMKIIFSFFSFFLLLYLNFTNDISFVNFANVLNPFSIMTGKETLTFDILIFKIIIAYLIYQLIISIRQNTRRK